MEYEELITAKDNQQREETVDPVPADVHRKPQSTTKVKYRYVMEYIVHGSMIGLFCKKFTYFGA